MGSPNCGAPGLPKPGQGRFLPPTRGRPKGAQNKTSVQCRENIISVFEGLGGVEAMIKWAKRNKSDFYKYLYAKLLPTQVTATVDLRDATELSDSELIGIIAAAGGGGAASQEKGEGVADVVH